MHQSPNRVVRRRPDYARGATLYCKRHLIERARKYYVDEGVTKYLQFRHRIRTAFKLPLDGFGNEAMRRKYFEPKRPVNSREPQIRESLRRRALEWTAFSRLTCSPRLFRILMGRIKPLSHKLVRMEMRLQDLGLDEGWKPLREQLEAAMEHAVGEIKTRQEENGLGSEAYAIKSIAQRRKIREMRYGNSGISDTEKDADTRGKLVCAVCHPEAQAQQSDRPWAPRWWIAMLRGMYQSRADIGLVERVLLNDSEARLCVVHGIVMVVIFREGEEPHFFVLDMEPLEGYGSRKSKAAFGLRVKTSKQAIASWKRKRQDRDGNEHEPSKRRRDSSSPLSWG